VLVIFLRAIVGATIAPAFSCSAFAGSPAEGVVVSVHDGDTLTVLIAKQQIEVRLAEIDAPSWASPTISARGNPSRNYAFNMP
jgi:endonuclease YncB( thermonuclease family)